MELKAGDIVISLRGDRSKGCRGILTSFDMYGSCYVKFDAPFHGHYGDPHNRDHDNRSWAMQLNELIPETNLSQENYSVWN